MTLKHILRRAVLVAVAVISIDLVAQTGALGKAYDNLLKKQGFRALKSPRSNFGVGTVIPVDDKKNLFIAGQDECFPGLQSSIQTGDVQLIDSKEVSNLKISASGNYSPTGSASFLSKLAAAFGYTSNSTMNVSFGPTTALNLTVVGLQNYLVGHPLNSVCADRLRDPKNAVIFSMARVATMTYTFSGERQVNGSANADALKSAMALAGSVEYDRKSDNSVTIKTPLYVGYNAFTLKDLSIQESGERNVVSVKIERSSAQFPE